MFYGGIFFQVIALAAVGYFSYDLILHVAAPDERKKIADGVIIVLSVITGIRFAWTFYAMPFWVTVDDQLKTLDVKFFLRKPILVSREDMLSYNDTTIKIKLRSGTVTYSGFYLHLGDGRKVLFSERNFAVEDYVYIESMLAYWRVRKEGENRVYERRSIFKFSN